MFKKKKPQIRLELTYPAANKAILWAVVPDSPGKYAEHHKGKWFRIAEYSESVPLVVNPNLISNVTSRHG
jgi:hypothetical protein